MMMTLRRRITQRAWALAARTMVVIEQIDPKDKVSTGRGGEIGIEARVVVAAEKGDMIGMAKDPGAMVPIDNIDIVIDHVRDIGKGKGQGTVMTENIDDTERSAHEVHTEARIVEVIVVAHDRRGQAETRAEKPDDTYLKDWIQLSFVSWFAKPV
jgi:hypothetical protein